MGAQTAALPRAVPENLGLKAVLGDWQPLTPPTPEGNHYWQSHVFIRKDVGAKHTLTILCGCIV